MRLFTYAQPSRIACSKGGRWRVAEYCVVRYMGIVVTDEWEHWENRALLVKDFIVRQISFISLRHLSSTTSPILRQCLRLQNKLATSMSICAVHRTPSSFSGFNSHLTIVLYQKALKLAKGTTIYISSSWQNLHGIVFPVGHLFRTMLLKKGLWCGDLFRIDYATIRLCVIPAGPSPVIACTPTSLKICRKSEIFLFFRNLFKIN